VPVYLGLRETPLAANLNDTRPFACEPGLKVAADPKNDPDNYDPYLHTLRMMA